MNKEKDVETRSFLMKKLLEKLLILLFFIPQYDKLKLV